MRATLASKNLRCNSAGGAGKSGSVVQRVNTKEDHEEPDHSSRLDHEPADNGGDTQEKKGWGVIHPGQEYQKN